MFQLSWCAREMLAVAFAITFVDIIEPPQRMPILGEIRIHEIGIGIDEMLLQCLIQMLNFCYQPTKKYEKNER